MGKPNITPERRKKMPPRGRSKFSLLMDVIKEHSMLELTPRATQEEAQKAFMKHVASRAFEPTDPVSGQLLASLINRCFPAIKPVMPECDLGFANGDSIDDMAAKVVSAAGSGAVSPDVAAALMGLLKDKAIINEKGELMRRLEELEERIKNGGGTPKAD
ncbi:MAG: hypothetical protein ACRDBH_08665 [Bosea sp. (in: a-proteobacteria)]